MREPVICFNQKSESFTKNMQANFSQMCHWATLSCKSKLCNASRAEKGRAKGAGCGLHVGKVSATTWKKPKGYEEVTPFGAQSFKTENSCSKLMSLRLYISLLWGCQIRCIHCATAFWYPNNHFLILKSFDMALPWCKAFLCVLCYSDNTHSQHASLQSTFYERPSLCVFLWKFSDGAQTLHLTSLWNLLPSVSAMHQHAVMVLLWLIPGSWWVVTELHRLTSKKHSLRPTAHM